MSNAEQIAKEQRHALFLNSISHLPREMQKVVIAIEKNHSPYFHLVENDMGVQANVPSPICLERDGAKELYSRHLNINFTKFLKGQNWCAKCNKTKRGYDLYDVIAMGVLEKRCKQLKIDFYAPNNFQSILKTSTDALVPDGKGNLVPRGPGQCIGVHELAPGHFARTYLEGRGYDMFKLYAQFDATYCVQELQDDKVYYATLPFGFKKTPQGRIIFLMWEGDIFRGWQGRMIEHEDDRFRYYYHPYTAQWFPYKMKQGEKWVPFLSSDTTIDTTNFKLPKYIIGTGTRSRAALMGLHAAISHPSKTVFIVEGVLDAARIGPPAVAVQGKGIGIGQVELLTKARGVDGLPAFTKYCVAADNDEPGKDFQKNIEMMFHNRSIPLTSITIPKHYKDVGVMPQDEADNLFRQYM